MEDIEHVAQMSSFSRNLSHFYLNLFIIERLLGDMGPLERLLGDKGGPSSP